MGAAVAVHLVRVIAQLPGPIDPAVAANAGHSSVARLAVPTGLALASLAAAIPGDQVTVLTRFRVSNDAVATGPITRLPGHSADEPGFDPAPAAAIPRDAVAVVTLLFVRQNPIATDVWDATFTAAAPARLILAMRAAAVT
jgi:hypothetical protein